MQLSVCTCVVMVIEEGKKRKKNVNLILLQFYVKNIKSELKKIK